MLIEGNLLGVTSAARQPCSFMHLFVGEQFCLFFLLVSTGLWMTQTRASQGLWLEC
jgi:hypothetical protein